MRKIFIAAILTLNFVGLSVAQAKRDDSQITTGVLFILNAFSTVGGKQQVDRASLLTGILSIAGGMSKAAEVAQIPPTSEEPLKKFRKSEGYKNLVQEFGAAKAEDILLDIAAGHSIEKVIGKYSKDPGEGKRVGELLAKAQAAKDAEKAPKPAPASDGSGHE